MLDVLALLATMGLTCAPPQQPALDDLIERADLIVVARVVATPFVKTSGAELAELAVERVLLGPDVMSAVAVAREPAERAPERGFEEGQTYVLFLEPWSVVYVAGKGKERPIEEILQGRPLYAFEGALWRRDEAGRVLISREALPGEGGPGGLEHHGREALVPLDSLLAWLSARIEYSLPSIRVRYTTTGANFWSFLVRPDLSIQGTGATTQVLDRRTWQSLWNELGAVRFDELPERVGASRGPCSPVGTIEMRTARGRKVVHVMGTYLEGLGAAERDAAERALRVWRLLPVEESF